MAVLAENRLARSLRINIISNPRPSRLHCGAAVRSASDGLIPKKIMRDIPAEISEMIMEYNNPDDQDSFENGPDDDRYNDSKEAISQKIRKYLKLRAWKSLKNGGRL